MTRRAASSSSRWSLLVFLLGLSAAILAWFKTSEAEHTKARAVFAQTAGHYVHRLGGVLSEQGKLLWFVRSACAVAGGVDAHGVEALEQEVVRRELRAGPLTSLALVARLPDAAGRTTHPVVCSRDATGASPWEGLAIEPDDRVRSDALERAAVADDVVMSAPVDIVEARPAGPRRGGLLALAVYGDGAPLRTVEQRLEALDGFVIAEYDLEELLELAVLRAAERDGWPGVHLVVRDAGLLVAEVGRPALADAEPFVASLPLHGRTWVLDVRPTVEDRPTPGELLGRASTILPVSILVAMLLTVLIVRTLLQQNALVQSQVDERTAELREKNRVLENRETALGEANRRLLEMSNTDALTGVLNRRAFEVQLDKERERALRGGGCFGLLFFDVDHFKQFNDRYGHVAGDEALRRVASILNNEARRIDCVARYGGEEFVVLTSDADAGGLIALGERIRSRIQEAAIEHEGVPAGVLTVSGGGSLSSAATEHDTRTVIEIADRCLYQAKSTGRNRVVMVM